MNKIEEIKLKKEAEKLAKKLMNSHLKCTPYLSGQKSFEFAKTNSLVTVDEILELLRFDLGHDATARDCVVLYGFVKDEITKK